MFDDGVYILFSLTIDIKNSLPILLCFHKLNGMTDKLCHIVIVAILTGGICNVPYEWDVSCNMSANIYGSLQVRVIMPIVLILSI